MVLDQPRADAGSLGARLAAVLPKDHRFGVYHLSTPPYKADALFSAPPNERPDRTYCENHFLAITIRAPQHGKEDSQAHDDRHKQRADDDVLVLGIEIYIYSTAHSTTLFISKADSTGYLQLLNFSRGTTSPIRAISSAFVEFLVAERKRKGIQLVVSLFARAQAQYLFPGSVENLGKHVLDDRGLVKWWCRVLTSMLDKNPLSQGNDDPRGYLVVPGLEPSETRALLPRTSTTSWKLGHPLERISHYTREFDWVPPRCLVPRFPDDPKSRFRDELDEEAFSSHAMKKLGNWKSVKTLDVFWEMMAFRQECSSGRMTGFIWIVFADSGKKQEVRGDLAVPQTPQSKNKLSNITPSTTPKKIRLQTNKLATLEKELKEMMDKKKKKKKRKTKLRGPIKTRQPKIKTEQRRKFLKIPETSPYYSWPQQGRGEILVDQDGYKRCMELLLHLDFANLEKGVNSTSRWIKDVGMGKPWGCSIKGSASAPEATVGGAKMGNGVNNLTGLVKRKREGDSIVANSDAVGALNTGPARENPNTGMEGLVNTLATGLVRKKPKV